MFRTKGATASRDAGSTPSEAAEAVPNESSSRASNRGATAVYRSYYRWLRASRLIMAAFLASATLFLLWLLPWLPGGLDTTDFPPNIAFTVYLLATVSILGLLTLAIRERAWRNRERLMIWSAVYDETTGLHNRAYLFDRLSLECDRAERHAGVFSLLVLQIRVGESKRGTLPGVSHQALQRVAETMSRLIRPEDLVALLSGRELGVLAIGTGRESRSELLERLRAAAAEELPRLMGRSAIVAVAGGAATYGADGKEPPALVQAARASATVGSLASKRAA